MIIDKSKLQTFNGQNVSSRTGLTKLIGHKIIKTQTYTIHTYHEMYHNLNGPAIIRLQSREREWWQYDKRHREDGPAVEYVDDKKWYIDGIEYTENSYWLKLACMKANGESQ